MTIPRGLATRRLTHLRRQPRTAGCTGTKRATGRGGCDPLFAQCVFSRRAEAMRGRGRDLNLFSSALGRRRFIRRGAARRGGRTRLAQTSRRKSCGTTYLLNVVEKGTISERCAGRGLGDAPPLYVTAFEQRRESERRPGKPDEQTGGEETSARLPARAESGAKTKSKKEPKHRSRGACPVPKQVKKIAPVRFLRLAREQRGEMPIRRDPPTASTSAGERRRTQRTSADRVTGTRAAPTICRSSPARP